MFDTGRTLCLLEHIKVGHLVPTLPGFPDPVSLEPECVIPLDCLGIFRVLECSKLGAAGSSVLHGAARKKQIYLFTISGENRSWYNALQCKMLISHIHLLRYDVKFLSLYHSIVSI